jgi:DNA-directed RNA polymerase specialized sigma24 family protein
VGHPDLLLADAVRQRIIGALDAELIGATRLEDATIADLAAWLGMTAGAVYKRRRRAELKLAEAIIDGRVRTRLTT